MIEVVVAMTMLSIVLMMMTQMVTAITLRGRSNGVVAQRNAALQLEANKLGALPFARLATWPTTDYVKTRNGFTYTRKLTITAQSPTRYTIKVVVVPSLDATKKDSVTFDRSLVPTSSPLCTGC